nr:F-box only protein 15 isoform X2 [Nothobranchius furzeri]
MAVQLRQTQAAHPAPETHPARCGGQPHPRAPFSGNWRGSRQPSARGSSAGGTVESRTPGPAETPPTKETLVERLPSEIWLKILSYLDTPSLCCLSQVNKPLHQLANDSILWERVYTSMFERRMRTLSVRDDSVEQEGISESQEGAPARTDLAVNHWKRIYFKRMASQEMSKWGRELRNTSPYTGLPIHTALVLRSSWRSLIFQLDVKTHLSRFFGCDSLVKLYILQPGVAIGMWRGQTYVSFIWVSLHFHRLVEKSLLGSPACPYLEPLYPPPIGDLDPDLGLHNYSLHLMLHNTSKEMLVAYFSRLSCLRGKRKKMMELRVIRRTNLSEHRSLSGRLNIPWKNNDLDGAVENCCFLSLTLVDEFQKPFWCISSPVYTVPVPREDYGSDNYMLLFQQPDGRAYMQLVWLEEQNQFLLIDLTISIPVHKINRRFSRTY